MSLNKLESILVTGFFRTGSTLLFYALRKCTDLQVFYEPYHPDIIEYVVASQNGLPNADRERLGHTVDGDYFEEYRNVNISEMISVFNKPARTSHHPILEASSEKTDLQNYVLFLHEQAKKKNKVPVLQANRLNFCFNWFKRNFPNNYNVLITRNSFDIFLSLQNIAAKDGLEIQFDSKGVDFWNVNSIFDSLIARHPFIKPSREEYYYKLCFIIEWLNRIESLKADLVVPYECLGNFETQKALVCCISKFTRQNVDSILTAYINQKYTLQNKKDKCNDIVRIEREVNYQISLYKTYL